MATRRCPTLQGDCQDRDGVFVGEHSEGIDAREETPPRQPAASTPCPPPDRPTGGSEEAKETQTKPLRAKTEAADTGEEQPIRSSTTASMPDPSSSSDGHECPRDQVAYPDQNSAVPAPTASSQGNPSVNRDAEGLSDCETAYSRMNSNHSMFSRQLDAYSTSQYNASSGSLNAAIIWDVELLLIDVIPEGELWESQRTNFGESSEKELM